MFNRQYKTGDCRFIFPKRLVTLGFRSRFFFDIYEKPEKILVAQYVGKDDRVLELGACIGVISCITNRLINNKHDHVVVEANPELIPTLNRNKEINGSGFIIEHCMVSPDRFNEFYIHPLIVGGSADRATLRKTHIVNRTLNELAQKHGSFTTLIIDIEGGEYNFFRRGKREYQHVFEDLY